MYMYTVYWQCLSVYSNPYDCVLTTFTYAQVMDATHTCIHNVHVHVHVCTNSIQSSTCTCTFILIILSRILVDLKLTFQYEQVVFVLELDFPLAFV